MPEIGTAYVKVSGDFTPLTSQLAGVVAPSKMSKLGKAAGVGLAAGFAAAGIGKVLFDVGKEFDAAYDNIRVQTGATGKEMRKLKGAFRDTIGSVPTDFDTASKAVAGLNQRLEVTGKPLRALSKQLTALSEVTGTDITENVEAVTRLFGDWSVKTKDQTDTLDGLFRIAQQTGGSVSELSRLLVQFGAPLRNLGIDLDFAAAMFANFEKSGVNISTVLSGLRLSVGNLATPTDELSSLLEKLGINAAKPEKALGQIFTQIKSLDDQASKALAIEVFGKRAGPDLRDAVVTGRFALQDLMKEFKSGDGTIRESERATRDLSEQWKLFTNRLKLVVEPVARDVFKGLGDLMKDVNRAFKEGGLEGVGNLIADRLQRAIPKITEAGLQIGAKLGPALIKGFFDSSPVIQFIAGAWLGAKFTGKAETAGKTFGRRFGRGMIVGLLLVAPDIIVAAFKLGEKIGHAIDNAVPSLANLITSGMKEPIPIADIIKSGQFHLVEERFKSMGLSAEQAHQKAVEAFRKLKDRGGQHVKDFGQNVQRTFDRTRSETDQATQGIARSTEQDMGKAEQSAKTHGKGIGRGISQPYKAADSVAVSALHSIEKNTNKALRELKQKPIAFGVKAPSTEEVEALHRQRGGAALVPGRGTGDIVPAMLEPGEMVLNRKAVRALGGAGRANQINKRVPRFAKGGEVNGDSAMSAMISRADQFESQSFPYLWGGGHGGFGIQPVDCSGAVSDVLHAGGLLNAPMVSGALASWGQPGRGPLTVFANAGHTFMSLMGEFFGTSSSNPGGGAGWFGNPGAGYISGFAARTMEAGQAAGAFAERIARVVLEGPNHVAKNIGQGVTDLVRSSANKFIASKVPSGSFGGGQPLRDIEGERFSATSYGPPWGGIQGTGVTATGVDLTDSPHIFGVAVDPDVISLGSKLRISPNPFNYGGTFKAFDTGGAIQGNRIDFYDWRGRDEQLGWGTRNVEVAQAQRGGIIKGFQRGGIVQKLAGGGAVQGYGGESPSTPLFDWFRVMFDQPLVDSMKGIVGKIGVSPNRFENMAASYSDALDFDELGTVAMALDTDDPIMGETIYGIARGRTAVGGLGSDLGSGWLDLELGQLILVRDRIRAAIPIVETLTKFVKGKIDALTKPGKNSYQWIADDIYKKAKDAYDELQDKIGNLRVQIKKLEGISKPTDEQKQRLSDLKGRLNGLVNALGVAKQIMDDSKFRVGAVGDVAGAFTARATALDAVKVALKTGGAEDGSWPSLEELQGRTGEAGSIFDTQLEITEALRAAGERAVSDVSDTGTTGEASALQQLEEQRRLTAVAEAQTPVFEQFFGRTFHTGGIVGGVGNQGVTVQAGEGIFTEEQMAAMGGSNVTVVVEDGAVDPNKIRVVVNDELSSVAARATRVGGTKGQKAVYR